MKKCFFILMWISLNAGAAVPMTVNVTSFGARGDGITDNSSAFEKAFLFCTKHHCICYIPKSDKPYIIRRTVHADIGEHQKLSIRSDGGVVALDDPAFFTGSLLWKLTPTFREIALFSFGHQGSNVEISKAFARVNHNGVDITGLRLDGSPLGFANEVLSTGQILSALDLSVDSVVLENMTFTNIKGYGLRTYGASYLRCRNLHMSRVGGRGVVPRSDSFGDGIYVCTLKPGALVDIVNCTITGALVAGRRSRDGITFEYSKGAYTANIAGCNISGFAKSLHFEDQASAIINVKGCHFSLFNYSIAMVANARSILKASEDTLLCGGTDGVDPGDGGPTINTNKGGISQFYRSVIDLNGRKRAYITMVGVRLLQDCRINCHDKNPYFADGNCIFQHCRFIGFGGEGFSFYAYGKNIASFSVRNCQFIAGGPVDAKGQRVNLSFTRSVSPHPLTDQIFNNR